MGDRIGLHNLLKSINSEIQLYYQPPASLFITYPCFIYKDKVGQTLKAADGLYRHINCYELVYIAKTPNVGMINTILGTFQYCSSDNIFTNDGLHHYVFTIYY